MVPSQSLFQGQIQDPNRSSWRRKYFFLNVHLLFLPNRCFQLLVQYIFQQQQIRKQNDEQREDWEHQVPFQAFNEFEMIQQFQISSLEKSNINHAARFFESRTN